MTLIETCGAVQEAIAFYRGREEPGFAHCKILIADKTGASAIIGFHNGKLRVDISSQCRGFGYGGQTLDALLAKYPKANVANGARILGVQADRRIRDQLFQCVRPQIG